MNIKTTLDPITYDVTVYTDGASRPHTNGDGGWAWVTKFEDKTYVHYGTIIMGTNNQSELMAAKHAIDFIGRFPKHPTIDIVSDSQYVIKGLSEWAKGWFAPPLAIGPKKNKNQWREAYSLWCNYRSAKNIRWVRGHKKTNRTNDHIMNDIADHYAGLGADNINEGGEVGDTYVIYHGRSKPMD